MVVKGEAEHFPMIIFIYLLLIHFIQWGRMTVHALMTLMGVSQRCHNVWVALILSAVVN